MPLISCPECRQQVSDQAAACPKCGYPMRPPSPVAPGSNPVADDELRRMIVGNPGRKIEAIKRCRDLYPGMGLKEAKEHVESLEGGVRRPARAGGCLSVLAFMVCGVVLLWLAGCASRSQVGLVVDVPPARARAQMAELAEACGAWQGKHSLRLSDHPRYVFPERFRGQSVDLTQTEVEVRPAKGGRTMLRSRTVGLGQSSVVRGNPARQSEVLLACAEHLSGSLTVEQVQERLGLMKASGLVPGRLFFEPDFRPIFDGRSLAGWSAPDLSFWRVEDGALTGETTREHQPPRLQFIVWEGEVRDFILRFQFRIFGDQANSGMQFRSQVRNGNEVHGYQADIDGQGKYLGGLWDEFGPRQSLAARGERVVIDEQGRRTVTRFAAAEELAREFRQGEWQDYEITAVGPKLTLRINGTIVAELEDREAGRAAAAGVLATALIPGEPMKVQYRNLRLREL